MTPRERYAIDEKSEEWLKGTVDRGELIAFMADS